MKIDLKALRESRAARMEKVRGDFETGSYEVLLPENLTPGSKLWSPTPNKTTEFSMRLLQYPVQSADNAGGDSVGDFVTYRTYNIHTYVGAGRKTIICPSTFNKPCPICKHYYEGFSKEERNSKEAQQFKPKRMVIFNALLKTPNKDGKVGYQVVVVNGGYFAHIGRIIATLNVDIKLAKDSGGTPEQIQKRIDQIYSYADLEFGYWLNITHAKQALASGKDDGGAVAFNHFVRVLPQYTDKPEPVSQQVLDRITDLDALIPKPMSENEIRVMLGEVPNELDSISSPTEGLEELPSFASSKEDVAEITDEPVEVSEDEGVGDDDFTPAVTPAAAPEPSPEPPAEAKKPAKEKAAKQKDESASIDDFADFK